jgi:CheY-like chemotaxis protein
MRLEFEHNSSAAVPFVENDVVSQDVSSEVERMFREGVRAAQEGKRADARNLLLRVTESNADNENAWLWLASISEYPEELMVFLNNVLRINPENQRALEWNKATKSLLAKTLVQRGMDAVEDKRKDFARQCFEQALEHEAENEMAWLWMASVADSEEEKAACFERVLDVNPENETARMSLKLMEDQKTQAMFAGALDAAFDGRQDEAKAMLETVLSRDAELEDAWVLKSHLANSFEERAECFLKLRVLNPENEMAKANLASWRMLADKLSDQPKAAESVEAAAELNEVAFFMPQTEAFSNEEAAAAELNEAEDAAETEAAAFGGAEEEVLETATGEAENAAEFSETEDSAENSFADFNERETTYFAQPEAFVAEAPVYEEFAMPDSPTQDLSDNGNYAQPGSMNFDAPETAQNEFFAAAGQNDEREESEDEEVRFEIPETQEAVQEFEAPEFDLASATEAEEAEMNWAFTSPENKQAEDYFQNFDDSDDIHKTQQANYDAEDFAPEAVNEPEALEAAAEMSVEANGEAHEEWRNTAPEVFVNYAPAAPPSPEEFSEAPTVAFSAMENPVVEEASSDVYEMPEADASAASVEEYYSQQFAEEAAAEEPSTNAGAEYTAMPAMEEKSASKNETVLCPFCDSVNEKQAFSCNSCQTVLTLSDLEMLLNQQTADADKLRFSVESMERENEGYGLSVEQMTNLGVGHINLKNYRQGFLYLQEAVRMNPSNVLLDAQVNALAIRLSEMEEQQTAHDLMSKNRKILVVDDSPTVRKLISGKLEKCGHEVVCAVDGADALEKIKELKPDLVLLDITMPRMDGYQVCKHIRGDEETKDVPVVMISGKDGFFDKVRGRMAGTSGYITKPFGPETLMKTVETYLN